MIKKHIIWPLLFLSCLFDCSSFQLLPKKMYYHSSGMGITVFIDSKQNPDSIIFAKVDDNKNLFSQEIFIGSNYHVENNMYLLNAGPGKYIAVALIYKSWTLQGASNEGEFAENYLFFPGTMISSTLIELKENEFRHMGRYIIKEQLQISDKMYDEYICDEAQLHYCQKITPGNLHKHAFYLDIPLGNHILLREKRSFSYWTELLESAKDRETELKRLNLALYDLKGGDWETMIKKRIEELNAGSE